MDIKELKVGSTVWLEDGSVVEDITATTDGESVRVKYVEAGLTLKLAVLVNSSSLCLAVKNNSAAPN